MNNFTSLTKHLAHIISETNGINISDTLELAIEGTTKSEDKKSLIDFLEKLNLFQIDKITIDELLKHEVSQSLFLFFKNFPLNFREEHIHLTGSLDQDFILPRLQKALEGEHAEAILNKIKSVYPEYKDISTKEDIKKLITLGDTEKFDRYLQILILPKLILTDKQAHKEAALHMANKLYHEYNIGFIRLKFTLSRASSNELDSIPGIENLTEEDVVLGLYEGFNEFKETHPDFDFVLSPSFRKEAAHFDQSKYKSKKEHINAQVEKIIELLENFPQLTPHLCDVDTVGNERELYRKTHFKDLKKGLRRLQYKGFSIRSHHGETWHTLKKGVQAVDNSMNIWHINTLEHGVSLGVNPNFYFHSLYLRVLKDNQNKVALKKGSLEYNEVLSMDWSYQEDILEKLKDGTPLSQEESTKFVKVKFHTAREVEHYQHDVLNRMIHKNVSLIALPSSNKKLTGILNDYKDHPFSWWEKKGVKLGIGTDNYITLDTNYINELLIVLFTDAMSLKITKLLMVATGENRRPYISQLLWKMRDLF